MSHSLKLSCVGKSIVTNSRTYVGFHVAAAVSPMCPHVTHVTRTLWPLRFFTVLPLLNLLCLLLASSRLVTRPCSRQTVFLTTATVSLIPPHNWPLLLDNRAHESGAVSGEPTREAKGRVSPILAAVVLSPTAGALMDGFPCESPHNALTQLWRDGSKVLRWIFADPAPFVFCQVVPTAPGSSVPQLSCCCFS